MIDLEDRLSDLLQRSANAVPIRPDLEEVTTAPRPAALVPDRRAVHVRRVGLAVGTCAALFVAAVWVSARDDAGTLDAAGVTIVSSGPVASGTPETAAAVILEWIFGDVVESVEALSDVGNADTSTSRAVEVTWRDGPVSFAAMVPADDQWILVELSTPTLGAQVVEAGPSYQLAIPRSGTVTIRQLLPDLSAAETSDTRVDAGGEQEQAVERHRWIAAELISDDGTVLRDFRPVLSVDCSALEIAGWPAECVLPLPGERRLPDGTQPAEDRGPTATTTTLDPGPDVPSYARDMEAVLPAGTVAVEVTNAGDGSYDEVHLEGEDNTRFTVRLYRVFDRSEIETKQGTRLPTAQGTAWTGANDPDLTSIYFLGNNGIGLWIGSEHPGGTPPPQSRLVTLAEAMAYLPSVANHNSP